MLLDRLAEERIREALGRGELEDLPGAGKPLDLSPDPCVPESLRMAFRILKNAGFIPPQVALRNEIGRLAASLAGEADDDRRTRGLRRLNLLLQRLDCSGHRALALRVQDAYYDQILERLAGNPSC